APHDDPCAGVLPERAPIPRGTLRGRQGPRPGGRAPRAPPTDQHQGSDPAGRSSRLGQGETLVERHLRVGPLDAGRPVVVLLLAGAGTVGILTLIALRLFGRPGHVTVAAKHEKQRTAARLAGADEVVRPEHATKSVRRYTSALKLTPERGPDFLMGGADVAIE